MWCGLTSRDEMPGVSDYGPQTPAPSQWPPVPQDVPSGWKAPAVGVQTGPLVQLSVPKKQSFGEAGVQVAPAVQATQVPASSQT